MISKLKTEAGFCDDHAVDCRTRTTRSQRTTPKKALTAPPNWVPRFRVVAGGGGATKTRPKRAKLAGSQGDARRWRSLWPRSRRAAGATDRRIAPGTTPLSRPDLALKNVDAARRGAARRPAGLGKYQVIRARHLRASDRCRQRDQTVSPRTQEGITVRTSTFAAGW